MKDLASKVEVAVLDLALALDQAQALAPDLMIRTSLFLKMALSMKTL